MKAAAFAYERPADLNAALALMANADGMTKIIAGGQSLGPMLNLRLVEPDLIVDISGLSELKQAERCGDELVIGACITHGEIVEAVRVPTMTPSAKWGYIKACRKTGEFAHAIAAVLIDPESASARAVIGAVEAPPSVVADAAALFGGRVTADFKRQFDARAADAILIKAGIANATDRHIHVAVLRRAIVEAAT